MSRTATAGAKQARETPRAKPLARKVAPKRVRPKNKISIAIVPEDLAFATQLAARLGVSLSAVFAEALTILRTRDGLTQLLNHLGGTEDLTHDELRAVEQEQRAAFEAVQRRR